jgi:hypothetical protein
MDFLPVTIRSMFVDHFARHGIDHSVHQMLRQSTVIAFVDDDISTLMVGQNILVEVAVKRPCNCTIMRCNHCLLASGDCGGGRRDGSGTAPKRGRVSGDGGNDFFGRRR